jgi:hypothetical protein
MLTTIWFRIVKILKQSSLSLSDVDDDHKNKSKTNQTVILQQRICSLELVFDQSQLSFSDVLKGIIFVDRQKNDFLLLISVKLLDFVASLSSLFTKIY